MQSVYKELRTSNETTSEDHSYPILLISILPPEAQKLHEKQASRNVPNVLNERSWIQFYSSNLH